MPSRNISDLDPTLQSLAHQFLVQCLAKGINAFLTCTYRSNREQDENYAQGRTKSGKIITKAQGGQSPHNCSLPDGTLCAKAFDFSIKTAEGSLDWDGNDAQWQRAIHIGESLGLVSGEHFLNRDYAHMELPHWKTEKI